MDTDSRKSSGVVIGICLLAGVLWLVGHSSTPSPRSHTDIVGQDACEAFHSLAHDAGEGLMTQTEIRDGLQGIYDKARYADTPAITSSSEEMLRVATQGGFDTPQMPKAINSMGHACQSIGA